MISPGRLCPANHVESVSNVEIVDIPGKTVGSVGEGNSEDVAGGIVFCVDTQYLSSGNCKRRGYEIVQVP